MRTWIRNLKEIIQGMRYLRPHLRAGRRLLILVLGLSFTGAFLEISGISLLVPLMSLLLGGEEYAQMRPISMMTGFLPGRDTSFYVLVFAGLILVSTAGKNLLLYLSQAFAARLKRRLTTNLRQSLFDRLLHADPQAIADRSGGEFANVFLQETTRTILMVEFLLLLFQRGAIGMFYFGMLLFISWKLTGLTALVALGIGIVVSQIPRRLARHAREVTQANARLAFTLSETFGGLRVIRHTHAMDKVATEFREVNGRQADIEEKASRTTHLMQPIAEVIAVAGAMLIVCFAYVFFVRPGSMLPSYLLGFGFVLIRFLPLVNQLYGVLSQTVYFAGGMREVKRWLETSQPLTGSFGTASFQGVREAICFHNVSFTYQGGQKALDQVDLTIPAGSMVAIVGPSGAGKTTLTQLLLRHMHPTGGTITVDGQPITDFEPDSWHRGMAVVEQEPFLFNDTLANNIGFGLPIVDRAQVDRAARIAQLQDLIQDLPQGLDSLVGERGFKISGGQRQRLAIARAVVRDPGILILDEATSSLDALSESLVQQALDEAMRERTVIVIAHRLSTIRHADRIIVLDHGRVAECGTWDELRHRNGLFAELVRRNAMSQADAEVTPSGPITD